MFTTIDNFFITHIYRITYSTKVEGFYLATVPMVEGVSLASLILTVGGTIEWEFAIKTQILLSGERFLQYPVLSVCIQL